MEHRIEIFHPNWILYNLNFFYCKRNYHMLPVVFQSISLFMMSVVQNMYAFFLVINTSSRDLHQMGKKQ